jgi:hypothetical protein
MNKHYITYLKEVEALGKKFQTDLDSRLMKARDQKRALSICHGDFNGQYHESRSLIREAGYDDGFFKTTSDLLTMDAGMSESDAFVKAHEDYKVGLSEENTKKLALNRALTEFVERIKQMEKLANEQDENALAPSTRKNTYWIGAEETEFVQLIYALVEAKRLPEKGKTKMVEEIAAFFGLTLSGDWQSNLSKSIHERNSDYEPAIFDELSEAWERYAGRREDKKKKPKKEAH